MKRLLSIIVTLLINMFLLPGISATEYGDNPERAEVRYVVSDGKKLNVRSKPSINGKLIHQLRPGDIVYVDSAITVSGDGYEWLEIRDRWGMNTSRTAYVTNLNRLVPEDNPLYDPATAGEKNMDDAVENSQDIAKIILLILSVILAVCGLIAYFMKNGKEKIIGKEVNGMRRTFFFNIAPYRTVIYITLILLGSIVGSVLILWLLGGTVFVVLWIVKIICYVLLWVGIACCIIGIICCLFGAFIGAIPAILGGILWYFYDEISAFGEACAEIGLKFFNQFNLFGFTKDLFIQYWEPAAIIVVAPLVIFLVLAIIWLLLAGGLILFEKIVTARYNIKHPCPHCQHPSEPAKYLSKSKEGYMEIPNNINLRPGMYGLFHIKHPYTGERMSTMIMNGRDKQPRICANCGRTICADEGTELHIALVGGPQSGKSTLTYRLISEIFRRAGKNRVEFTDIQGSIKDRAMIRKIENIAQKEQIEDIDLPSKTTLDDTSSTQLIIKRNRIPIPYRLFINDVGGELFDPENSNQSAFNTRFFINVNSILVILDPTTTDLSDFETSEEYITWVKNHDDGTKKLKVNHLQDAIVNQLSQYGVKTRRVHINFILPKIDLGYLPEHIDIKSQDDLRNYVENDMGLGKFVAWGEEAFASCSFYAVGSMSKSELSNIDILFKDIFIDQLDIDI